MKVKVLVIAALFMVFGVSGASAATIDLFEWAFNNDGTINSTVLPGGINSTTGLGTASITISGAGAHYFIAYFDHEIDEAINTFFNESGGVVGAPAAGQSWEIDEPGFVYGDIYTNFLAGTLDNSYGLPPGELDDVSMALGWSFSLLAGETATISLQLATTPPLGGFYLQQIDLDSQENIYFSSSVRIGGEGPVIPEPATMLLLGSGLAGLVGFGRKKLFKK